MSADGESLKVEFVISVDDVRTPREAPPSVIGATVRARVAAWIAVGAGILFVAALASSVMEGLPVHVRVLVILFAAVAIVAWILMSDRLNKKRIVAVAEAQPPSVDDLMRIGRHTVTVSRAGVEVTMPYKSFRIPAMRFDHVERSAQSVQLCFQPGNVVAIPESAFASASEVEAFARGAATLLIEGMEAADATFVRCMLAHWPVMCPSCGYNLLAVAKDKCPECGLALTVEALVGEGAVRPGRAGG